MRTRVYRPERCRLAMLPSAPRASSARSPPVCKHCKHYRLASRERGIVPLIPKRSPGRACRIGYPAGSRPSRIASRVQYASRRARVGRVPTISLVRPTPCRARKLSEFLLCIIGLPSLLRPLALQASQRLHRRARLTPLETEVTCALNSDRLAPILQRPAPPQAPAIPKSMVCRLRESMV